METINMFEKASKIKLRFAYKGLLSVEDLWDLGLKELDKIFKGMNRERKAIDEESLLAAKTAANKELELGINIVKHIVEVKVLSADKKLKAADRRAKKAKIIELIAAKKDENLANKSESELMEMLDGLDEDKNSE